MKKIIFFIILFFSLLHYACEHQNKQPGKATPYIPKIVIAKTPLVKEIKVLPEVIPIKNVKVRTAGKPKTVKIKSNIHPLNTPKAIPAGKPLICIPGKDTFRLPKMIQAIDSPFFAGNPEVVDARPPFIKDNNPSGISSFKVLQGLKTNNIFPMIQDKAGNIWISTWEGGVSKYDGRSFTHYTTSQGLSSDNVWSILEDSKGNIWFGTIGGGLNKYDGRSFTHYSTHEGMSDNDATSIIEDSKGNLWIGTTRGGVNKYDGKTFLNFTNAQGLVHNHVRSIVEDSNGNIWFGTAGGISKYDGRSFSNYTTDQGLNNNDIWCIAKDKNRNLWISSWGNGIDKYDGKSFTHYSSAEGLSSDNVWKMMEDKVGNLWICTMDKGVNKFDGKSFTWFDIDQGLSNNVVHSILEDKSGNIWLGTDGGGVNKYDGGYFSHFHHTQGLTSGNISCSMEDRNGNIWIGTWGSGIDKYDGKSFTNYSVAEGLNSDNVACMLEDKMGNLWFGTSDGVSKYDGISFTRIDTTHGLSNGFIAGIAEDKAGNIWMGTYGGGINKYDGKTITAYSTDQGISSDDVLSIYEDSHNNIWVGTYHGGINKFDGKSFTHYTTSQGLSNNRIGSIREDREGNMWFLSTNGLSRMRNSKNENSATINPGNSQIPLFKNYLLSDGFLGVGSDYNTLSIARDGKIWAGAVDRLSSYNSENDTPDSILPNIEVSSILLFNENINWPELEKNKDTTLLLSNGVKLKDFEFTGLSKWYYLPENLKLAYTNNYLTFRFVGITTKRTQHVKYQYFLDGLDQSWNTITQSPEATYNNLPPGSYIFKVKAVNSEGYWSEEFAYSFTILPPWWKTLWVRLFAIISLAGIFYGVIRWRLHEKFRLRLDRSEKEKQLAEMRQRTTELEMQALRAQMNPHFIFNSLNSINRFILQNNKAQASEYLTKFSRLVRLILQNSQASLIPLESELESLQLYLELESVRFDHHFEFNIIVDDELDTDIIKVPPLIIQPYAENAIWHGLMNKEEKGHLEIELFQHDDTLCCKITDDGIGRKKAAELKSKSASTHKSMGMKITASRIEMLQQKNQWDTSIKITDLVLAGGNAGGTEVILKIPVMK